MAEEMNPDINPSLIDQVLVAIKLTETEGEKQPYQTLHPPVELYIYGTDSEIEAKVKQFNEDGFVTKLKKWKASCSCSSTRSLWFIRHRF